MAVDDAELFLSISETVRTSLPTFQEIASQLYSWNWMDTTGGSISIRLPQDPNLFALTPTHAGFQRWNLMRDGLIVLDRQLNLKPYSTCQRRAHPSAIIHNHIYERFPDANSVLHTHAPYSLAFASLGRTIKPYTLQSQMLGDVPCLETDVDRIGDRSDKFNAETEKIMTTGMMGYGYAYEHFEEMLQQIDETLVPRSQELQRHGLAFTAFKHGIFVIARNIDEAFDNTIRVERNAQVQILSSQLHDNMN